MLYRNLLAMDAEELLRGHPVDGVVLMGGCDKTTPGLLAGATSMNCRDLSSGRADAARQLEGQDAGLGLGCLEILGRAARRKISDKDWVDVEAGIARSYGTCMTMGTASTMTRSPNRSA
jgi:Dihydroxyacid dehydratase/phosphogluconate dehydratase